MPSQKLTLTNALDMVQKEYERAKGLAFVRNPLAYALYHVWKAADGQTPENENPCEACGYKSYYTQVAGQNDCNDCGSVRTCQYVPRVGSICRINCPLWRPKG